MIPISPSPNGTFISNFDSNDGSSKKMYLIKKSHYSNNKYKLQTLDGDSGQNS